MATNTALLALLGLSTIEHVTSVDIALRPNDLPRITVQQVCRDFQPATAHFRLMAEPLPSQATPPQMGLDAQCAEALQRLHKFIERSAFFARLEMLEHSIKYQKEERS